MRASIHFLFSASQNVTPGPGASGKCGNLVNMQIIRSATDLLNLNSGDGSQYLWPPGLEEWKCRLLSACAHVFAHVEVHTYDSAGACVCSRVWKPAVRVRFPPCLPSSSMVRSGILLKPGSPTELVCNFAPGIPVSAF